MAHSFWRSFENRAAVLQHLINGPHARGKVRRFRRQKIHHRTVDAPREGERFVERECSSPKEPITAPLVLPLLLSPLQAWIPPLNDAYSIQTPLTAREKTRKNTGEGRRQT